MPFAVVAVVSLVASLGLAVFMPGKLPVGAVSLRQRLALASEPLVLKTLLVTLFWAMATFTVFTFVAPLLAHVGVTGWQVSGAFFLFGAASAAGNAYGGVIVDRIGSARTLTVALGTLAASLAAIAVTATFASGTAATVVVLALMVVWGAAGWAFYPAQSSRLIEVAPAAPVVVLSLNSSALFFGQAGGAALGSFVQTAIPLTDLGLVGATSALIALAVLFWSRRSVPRLAVAPAE